MLSPDEYLTMGANNGGDCHDFAGLDPFSWGHDERKFPEELSSYEIKSSFDGNEGTALPLSRKKPLA